MAKRTSFFTTLTRPTAPQIPGSVSGEGCTSGGARLPAVSDLALDHAGTDGRLRAMSDPRHRAAFPGSGLRSRRRSAQLDRERSADEEGADSARHGVGHMPKYLIEQDLRDKRLISITGRHLRRTSLQRREAPHGPIANRLWSYIEEQAPAFVEAIS